MSTKLKQLRELTTVVADTGDIKDIKKSADPTQKSLNPASAEVYFNQGNAYLLNRQFNQAISYYMRATEINPVFAPSYNNLDGFLLPVQMVSIAMVTRLSKMRLVHVSCPNGQSLTVWEPSLQPMPKQESSIWRSNGKQRPSNWQLLTMTCLLHSPA